MSENTGIPGPSNTPTKYPTRVYKTRHYRKQAEALDAYSSPLRSLSKSKIENSPKTIPEDEELEIKSPIFDSPPRKIVKIKYGWIRSIGLLMKWVFLSVFVICSLASMGLILFGYYHPDKMKMILEHFFKSDSRTIYEYFLQLVAVIKEWYIQIAIKIQNQIEKNFPQVEL